VRDCPACEEKSVELIGQGTEKIEEEVAELFPDFRVARMDTDTTTGKQSYDRIISDFQNKKTHILVGTQMLSKGLDFNNVSVVGIISADGMLHYPDFRSHERSFQLMTQAAGRSGRKIKRGTVIIQTSDPEQPIYRFIVNNDFEGFYNLQLTERKLFRYPPFYRLIRIVFKDRNEQKVESASILFANILKGSLKERVLGPNKPVISKIQRYHIREILLKLEVNLSPQQVRDIIQQAESRLRSKQEFKYVVVYFDVDGV
jgi:primosomal protein N' (replication factor Y)